MRGLKLIADKEKKALPDETTFVVPEAWQEQIVVRRYGRTREPAALDDTAEESDRVLHEMQAATIEDILGHPRSEPDLVAAVRSRSTPLGVAATALVRFPGLYQPDLVRLPKLADLWVAEHGLPFAVHAATELGRLHLAEDSAGKLALRYWQPGDRDGYWSGRCHVVYWSMVAFMISTTEQLDLFAKDHSWHVWHGSALFTLAETLGPASRPLSPASSTTVRTMPARTNSMSWRRCRPTRRSSCC
jgi:hypothetical protein